MEPNLSGPCESGEFYIRAMMMFFIGMNTMLTTWLTLRAKKRDKKEANGEQDNPGSHPLA